MTETEADALHLLRLLWRKEGPTTLKKQGPRPALKLDQIIEKAIFLADSEGLVTLTMRHLAQVLKVSTMSLYNYIANKHELVALMIDQVSAEPAALPTGKDWRKNIKYLALANLQWYQNHPWLLEVYSERPPLGPGVLAKYERELAIFEPLPLSDLDKDNCLTFVLNFVRANAADQLAAKQTALTNQQWWETQAATLAEWIPPQHYPLATRIGSAAGEANQGAYNSQLAFEFGLQRLLAGLEPLIQSV